MALTKEIFRKECLEKLKNSSQHNQYYKDMLLVNKMLVRWGNIKNKNILFYYPMGHEPDLRKLFLKLRKKNNILLPFMEGESFKMVLFRLPLKQKKFGIFEAGDSLRNIKKIDIAIVPVIGVDARLQRVGFGKGMYDRFFAKLKKKPYTIFVQRDICYTKESICDPYDISCDLLISSKETVAI